MGLVEHEHGQIRGVEGHACSCSRSTRSFWADAEVTPAVLANPASPARRAAATRCRVPRSSALDIARQLPRAEPRRDARRL